MDEADAHLQESMLQCNERQCSQTYKRAPVLDNAEHAAAAAILWQHRAPRHVVADARVSVSSDDCWKICHLVGMATSGGGSGGGGDIVSLVGGDERELERERRERNANAIQLVV